MAEAREAIERARRLHPDSEEFLIQHVDLLQDSGRQAEAQAVAEAEIRSRRTSRVPRLRLAMLLLDQGRLAEALPLIPGVLPGSTTEAAWRSLADIWRALGRERDRRRSLERLLALEPTGDVRVALAQSLLSLGVPERALACLEPADGAVPVLLAKAEALGALNRHDEALTALRAAVAAAPDDALAQMRLGLLLRRLHAFEEAEAALQRAVELRMSEPVVHEQLAILLSDRGRLDEALASLERALQLAPSNPSLRFNLAVLQARRKRWTDAEQGLRQVLAANPLNLAALGNLGRVLAEQQRHEEAADVFETAIELAPRDHGARQSLVNALQNLRRHDDVVQAARAWVDNAPDDPHAWRAVAMARATIGDSGADDAARQVAALAPDTPLSFETLGLVALAFQRHREATAWFDRGLALAPQQVSLIMNRSIAIEQVEGLEATAREMERALAIEPESRATRMNLALVHLRLGRFREGWRGYESRTSALHGPGTLLDAKEAAGGRRPDLAGAIVLVRAEQGLGDTIHFMRYVPRLAAEAREVIFHVQDQIAWMAWGLAPNVRVCGYRDPVAAHADYQVSLMSLPGYYETDLTSIPDAVPYVTASAQRIAAWRASIGDRGFKVGLVWHTNPAHGNIRRWVPLDLLAPLGEIEGVRLISLQKQFGIDQLPRVQARVPIEALGPPFDEGPDAFADAAAVLTHLDLVISIDTSMAHLAGAMARPVWVLLPASSDFRWLWHRHDSPWYPTARLFQQPVPGAWAPVADEVHAALAEIVKVGRDGIHVQPPDSPPIAPVINLQSSGSG